LGEKPSVLLGGRRAERGGRPVRLYLTRSKSYHLMLPGRRFLLSWVPWRGWWCEAWAVIVGGKVVDFGYYPQLEKPVKKIDLAKGNGGERPIHLAAVETEILGRVPQIVSHLTHVAYDDGSPREPGTITIRVRGTTWSVEARDWNACARLVASALSCDDAFALLDLLLGSDNAPWEADRYLEEKKPQKKSR